ncbi:DUF420 domain-containing protein [Sulfuriroseicoccus oceanibius]|uniref:DUF420 domain-containing protein n=1 Tax=Sulfuriroseicoccus oceanibius TaxID=2707525 RepID=A0A7T7F3T9_9BACT|nr:DUF420 domain-containing protein [Sulfuriroseicoccus oceanibius]QQL46222.1 DUF420 domain-containing protein [Sulfuriroseicoccus oceanibius]
MPFVNSCLNATAVVFLTVGFIAIKMGAKELHRKMMVSAFVTSAIFLVGYVAHKIYVKGVHTPFPGEGTWKAIYLTMLASHVILAMAIVPMILITMKHAIKGDFEKHRRIARWTFPIWYYVSITGVLVYCFLYVWFV